MINVQVSYNQQICIILSVHRSLKIEDGTPSALKNLVFKNLTRGSQFTFHGEMTNEFKGGQFVIKLIYELCRINSKT